MEESNGKFPTPPRPTDSLAERPRLEHIVSGRSDPLPTTLPGVLIREFASCKKGAKGVSTGTATFGPSARMPYHKHTFSEAVTLLEGEASFAVEGRTYRLRPFDCLHVPSGVAHAVENPSERLPLVAHWSFATDTPSREAVEDFFPVQDLGFLNPGRDHPEHIVRFRDANPYGLAEGTRFRDLFAGRFGAAGICGGYGEFDPGCSLPCHVHEYDESITIVSGEAICEVMGRRYRLSNCDTAIVPRRRPHRFLNESCGPMAMVWVYAGSEPEREIVDAGYCRGSIEWRES